jgi:hypothetical protein
MVDNQKTEELMLLYRCFSRNESNLVVIIQCLNNYIEITGQKIVEDTKNL